MTEDVSQRGRAASTTPDRSGPPARVRLWRTRAFWLIVVLTAVVGGISEAIGEIDIHVGPSQINLLPIIWAVLIGTIISVQPWRPLPARAQRLSAALIAPVIAVFMARLGLLVGPDLSKLGGSGAALLLQEVGHFFGSVIFCLPIAVIVLGMGRSSIGATYSIDREPMIGIIAERYGGESPEYKGALGTYVIGSIFGAVIVAVVASILGSLHVFTPIALSIGTAVGSTSMMLGGMGALTTMFPDKEGEIVAYAGAANAITGLTGTYAAAFLSLPLARKLYPVWTRVAAKLGRTGQAVEPLPEHPTKNASEAQPKQGQTSLSGVATILIVLGMLMLGIQTISAHKLTGDMTFGFIVLLAISYIAIAISRVVSWLPYIVVTMLIATLISAPFSPIAPYLTTLLANVDLVAIGTPVLAIVGLSLGLDAKFLVRTGWKAIIAAALVICASFIAATAVADISTTYLSL